MKIGEYLSYGLDKSEISKKYAYEVVSKFFMAQQKEYITYQRFCNKFNEDNLTSTEVMIIGVLIPEYFKRLFGFFEIEVNNTVLLRTEFDVVKENIKNFYKLKGDELLVLDDTKVLAYTKLQSMVSNQEKHTIHSLQIFENSKCKTPSIIKYLSYSLECNEFVFEVLSFEDVNDDLSHGSFTHKIFLHKTNFKKLLELYNVSYEVFNNFSLHEKLIFAENYLNESRFLDIDNEQASETTYPLTIIVS